MKGGENMHNFAKKIMECVKTKVEAKGLDNLNDSELCRLEKWTAIANSIAEYDYHYHITEAMEDPENEYGVDYDENGPMRRGYRGRSATTGRYVHRPYTEVMRDMDMPHKMYYGGEMQSRDGENRGYSGDMHSYPDGSVAYYGGENKKYMRMMEDANMNGYKRGYSDGMSAGRSMNSGSGNNSISNARRGYEEAKQKGNKEERVNKLNEMMTSIKDEIKPLLPEMDVPEKSVVRNGLQTIQNMVM